MKEFIAIIRYPGPHQGFQDFDTEAQANAHVAEHGGWVAGNPGGDRFDYWVIDAGAKTIGYDQTTQDADQAMRKWKYDLLDTDKTLPRYVEDVCDVHGSPNARTQKLLDDKKALRAARP